MSQECDRTVAKEISELSGGTIQGWIDLEELAEIIAAYQSPDRLASIQIKKDLDNCAGMRFQEKRQADDMVARHKAETFAAKLEVINLLAENRALKASQQVSQLKLDDFRSQLIQLTEAREEADRKTLQMESALCRTNAALLRVRGLNGA